MWLISWHSVNRNNQVPLAFLLALVGDCRSISFSWLRELFLKERLGMVQSLCLSFMGCNMSTSNTDSQLPLHCNTPAETGDNNVPCWGFAPVGGPSRYELTAVTGFREFRMLRAPHYLGLSFTSPAIGRTLLWNTFRLSTVKIWKDDKLCCIQTEGKQNCSHNGKTAIEHFRKLGCYGYIKRSHSFPNMGVEVRGRRERVSVSKALPIL